MSDSHNKIFAWQLVIAAVVGIVWAVLWELDGDEMGFFFDLPWGMVVGLFWGLVAVLIIGLLGGGIWALISMMQGAEGGFAGAMSANLDRLGGSSMVDSVNRALESLNASGIGMGIEWAFKVAFAWGIAGGLIWGFELNFAVSVIVVLLVSLVGALAIVGFSGIIDTLADSIGEGYGWLDGLTSSLGDRWESAGMVAFWGFAGAFAFGVGGALASGGLGTGIVQAVVLVVVALIAALAGGVVGSLLKRSMETG